MQVIEINNIVNFKIEIIKDNLEKVDNIFNKYYINYNYLNLDVIIKFIYGNNYCWSYNKKKMTFEIKDTLNYKIKEEFKKDVLFKMLKKYKVTVNKDRTVIHFNCVKDFALHILRIFKSFYVSYKFIEQKKEEKKLKYF